MRQGKTKTRDVRTGDTGRFEDMWDGTLAQDTEGHGEGGGEEAAIRQPDHAAGGTRARDDLFKMDDE